MEREATMKLGGVLFDDRAPAATALILLIVGAGPLSLDALIVRRRGT